VRNFRQALASPHLGSLAGLHDSGATNFFPGFLPPEDEAMTRATRLLSIAVLSAFVVTGCAARGVRIAELKTSPGKYENKRVSVTGVVTNSFGIPLVPFQLYNIDDGTGSITVVSRETRTPSKGARVQVKGKVNEVAVLGGRSIGLHIDEDGRKFK
jgi:hypothetical protein